VVLAPEDNLFDQVRPVLQETFVDEEGHARRFAGRKDLGERVVVRRKEVAREDDVVIEADLYVLAVLHVALRPLTLTLSVRSGLKTLTNTPAKSHKFPNCHNNFSYEKNAAAGSTLQGK
jgi:hypothetical protein